MTKKRERAENYHFCCYYEWYRVKKLREIRYVYQRINQRFGIKAKVNFHFTILLFFIYFSNLSLPSLLSAHNYLIGNFKKMKKVPNGKNIYSEFCWVTCVCVMCGCMSENIEWEIERHICSNFVVFVVGGAGVGSLYHTLLLKNWTRFKSILSIDSLTILHNR